MSLEQTGAHKASGIDLEALDRDDNRHTHTHQEEEGEKAYGTKGCGGVKKKKKRAADNMCGAFGRVDTPRKGTRAETRRS